MRVEEGFQLTAYSEGHPYTDDLVLPNLLQRLIPHRHLLEINADLVRFGQEIKDEVASLTPLVHEPKLTQYDQWGRRIDRLDTSEGWRRFKDIAIREGLVAIPHERQYGEYSRIYGFAKVLIFVADSHGIMCPMSMTDGAARVLELFGTEEMKRDIRSRLISRDPSIAFTSGQWMTERPGGSDVSQTETVAKPVKEGSGSPTKVGSPYYLNGFKWFSSATDSQISVALARTGPLSEGSRSLSLFLVPLRLPLLPTISPSSISNGIFVHRLKDKFGTHALPTAELSLNNTAAYLLSPLNQGVRTIAPVLNITRIHSAVSLVGGLSRALAIARSYAKVRSITSRAANSTSPVQQLLMHTPLHVALLAKVGVTYQALAHLAFGTVALLGRSECGVADSDEETRLRLLTPVVKAFVSERGVSAMEDCMTCLGGQGYMEENSIGRLIRDATVDRIWEGTINVLALDLMRAASSKHGIKPFAKWAGHIISSLPVDLAKEFGLGKSIDSLHSSLETINGGFSPSGASSPFIPRPLLFLFAHVAAALYLLEHVVWAAAPSRRNQYHAWRADLEVFKRWVEEGLDSARVEVERVIALENPVGRAQVDLDIVYGPGLKQAKL
ncbi:acyl-CoA dehydrogenase/oxidase [Hysterangium stoloniferum]|nr:acyl-CoA dehydrogenase/oxidase [Hysterangium stoloniferum]